MLSTLCEVEFVLSGDKTALSGLNTLGLRSTDYLGRIDRITIRVIEVCLI